MTELLERAVETMRGLPVSIVQLSAEDEESLRASLLEAERGEFAYPQSGQRTSTPGLRRVVVHPFPT